MQVQDTKKVENHVSCRLALFHCEYTILAMTLMDDFTIVQNGTFTGSIKQIKQTQQPRTSQH